MNEIMIFNNPEFGSVRTVCIDGEPWLVGKDVADILEYRNGSRDINRHVDADDRRKIMIYDGNQRRETIVINESGLYSLVLSSKMLTAKKFKRWVTSEVLPTIRKNMWASYRLGRIYLFGADNIESDKTKAMIWLTKSAEAGNEYAEKLINYSNNDYAGAISNTVISLLFNLGCFIEEENSRKRQNISNKVDKKLQRIIHEKKEALGIKTDSISINTVR